MDVTILCCQQDSLKIASLLKASFLFPNQQKNRQALQEVSLASDGVHIQKGSSRGSFARSWKWGQAIKEGEFAVILAVVNARPVLGSFSNNKGQKKMIIRYLFALYFTNVQFWDPTTCSGTWATRCMKRGRWVCSALTNQGN